MDIEFISEGFPSSGPVANGTDTLSVTWDDILWSAITVGRPNRHFVFRYGTSSLYEAVFRASVLRMTIEQVAPGAKRLRRTDAAKSLDPSEKGAVNYFLGLTMCKLFAEMKLGAPWLLHLDVFRSILNPRLLSGRSRPDLIGRTVSGEWLAIESKGRVSPPYGAVKAKAKAQAERVVQIGSEPVTWRIGSFAYFKNDVLQFFWIDPQPGGMEPANGIRLNVSTDDMWKYYYQPILALVGVREMGRMAEDGPAIHIREGDFQVKVVPEVAKCLCFEKWQAAAEWCGEFSTRLKAEKTHGDGVQIIAGASWKQPFRSLDSQSPG